MKGIRKRGFTLVELLTVVAVLGLLTSFTTIVVPSQLKKGRDTQRKSDLERIKIALYDYYFDADCFPKDLPDCEDNFGADGMVYMNHFPCDPSGSRYGYQVEDKECSQWFKILTNLENTRDSGIVKVGCQFGCGPECNYNYGLASTNIRVNDGCPEGEEPPEECFIATVVYGEPSASEVEILREFRDEVLLQNSLGQELVEFYYQKSPPIAEFISEHPRLKELVRRVGIDTLIKIIRTL